MFYSSSFTNTAKSWPFFKHKDNIYKYSWSYIQNIHSKCILELCLHQIAMNIKHGASQYVRPSRSSGPVSSRQHFVPSRIYTQPIFNAKRLFSLRTSAVPIRNTQNNLKRQQLCTHLFLTNTTLGSTKRITWLEESLIP